MGSKLFAGNLPFDIGEDQLRALFAADGRTVEQIQIITDRMTGRPRGFAFVTMGSQAEADAAAAALNGKEVSGRAIVVNEAQEKAPRPSFGGGGFGGPGGGGQWRGGKGPGGFKSKGSRRNVRAKKRGHF
jgi:RNA recognition motif-containing protein